MRLLADECCESALVEVLRQAGYDVKYAAETLSRWPDHQLLHLAYEEKRLVLTNDKDFGELVYRLQLPAHGVILLRFAEGEREVMFERLLYVLSRQAERLAGCFTVIEANKTRIRLLER